MSDNIVKIIFIFPNGDKKWCDGVEGESLLTVARNNKIPLEGACEGSLACATCHVVVDSEWYDKLDEISSDENDMLDFAPVLTETSRLGCQVTLTKQLDGMVIRLPSLTRHIQSK